MDHLKHVLLTVDCMMVHMVWWVFILKIKYQTYNLKNVMLCSILFECVIKGEVSVRGKQKINKTELLFDHKCSKIFTYTLLRFLFLFRLEMGSCRNISLPSYHQWYSVFLQWCLYISDRLLVEDCSPGQD